MASTSPLTVWTIGHSTRSLAEFVELLKTNRIELLADVRRFPGSRKYPHFNQEQLATTLGEEAIEYRLLADLGGRRRARPDSPNTAWRNASFRGYADYMETAEFQDAVGELMRIASNRRTAIMCSEAVWWRCHRSMIADELKVRGATVLHILSSTKVEPHPYTSAAKVIEGRLSYAATDNIPSAKQQQLDFS